MRTIYSPKSYLNIFTYVNSILYIYIYILRLFVLATNSFIYIELVCG